MAEDFALIALLVIGVWLLAVAEVTLHRIKRLRVQLSNQGVLLMKTNAELTQLAATVSGKIDNLAAAIAANPAGVSDDAFAAVQSLGDKVDALITLVTPPPPAGS